MCRLAIVVASLAIGAVAAVSLSTDTASACSRGEFDPVAESDVIVEGRYVSYHAGPAEPVVFESPKNGETSILGYQLTETIEFAVARSLKGFVAESRITIVNRAWVDGPPGGSCGSAAHDPTGRYSITGLVRRDDGMYAFNSASFFSGSNPGAADYDRALSHLASRLGLPALPSLGAGPASSRGPISRFGLSAAVAAAALLLLTSAAITRGKGA